MSEVVPDQGVAVEFVKFLTAQLKESRDEVKRLSQVRFTVPGLHGLL